MEAKCEAGEGLVLKKTNGLENLKQSVPDVLESDIVKWATRESLRLRVALTKAKDENGRV
jgi:hypothetical protein